MTKPPADRGFFGGRYWDRTSDPSRVICRAIADTLIYTEDYSGMKGETIAALMTDISDKLTGIKTLLERKDDERG